MIPLHGQYNSFAKGLSSSPDSAYTNLLPALLNQKGVTSFYMGTETGTSMTARGASAHFLNYCYRWSFIKSRLQGIATILSDPLMEIRQVVGTVFNGGNTTPRHYNGISLGLINMLRTHTSLE